MVTKAGKVNQTHYSHYTNDYNDYWNWFMTRVMDGVERLENQASQPVGGWDAVCITGMVEGDTGGTETTNTEHGLLEALPGTYARKVRIRFIDRTSSRNVTSGRITSQIPNPFNPKYSPAKAEMLLRLHPFAYAEHPDVLSPRSGEIIKVYERDGLYFYRAVSKRGFSEFYDDVFMNYLFQGNAGRPNASLFGAGASIQTLGTANMARGTGNPSDSSTNSIDPVGWQTKAGVRLEGDLCVIFMNYLATLIPHVPLVVTSSARGNSAQARAIVAKMKLGDRLHEDTGYSLKKVKAWCDLTGYIDGRPAPNFGAKEEALIKKWYDESGSKPAHNKGLAIDLRINGLSPSELQGLKSGLSMTGAAYQQEPTPPHIHVDLRSWDSTQAKEALGYQEEDFDADAGCGDDCGMDFSDLEEE